MPNDPAYIYCVFEWTDFANTQLLGLARTFDVAKTIAERMEPRGVRWQKEHGRMTGYVTGLTWPLYCIERREVVGDDNAK